MLNSIEGDGNYYIQNSDNASTSDIAEALLLLDEIREQAKENGIDESTELSITNALDEFREIIDENPNNNKIIIQELKNLKQEIAEALENKGNKKIDTEAINKALEKFSLSINSNLNNNRRGQVSTDIDVWYGLGTPICHIA